MPVWQPTLLQRPVWEHTWSLSKVIFIQMTKMTMTATKMKKGRKARHFSIHGDGRQDAEECDDNEWADHHAAGFSGRTTWFFGVFCVYVLLNLCVCVFLVCFLFLYHHTTDDNDWADPHAAAGVQDGQHGEDLVLHHWVGQLRLWRFANLETVS